MRISDVIKQKAIFNGIKQHGVQLAIANAHGSFVNY